MTAPTRARIIVPRSGARVFPLIKAIIKTKKEHGLTNDAGNGEPGLFLEQLLGIKANNADSPDIADWEIKFHGGTALLTMFHKDPEPQGIMTKLVKKHGWPSHGHTSFRHTITGGPASPRGFIIVNERDRIVVKNDKSDIEPYWSHNMLLTSFAAKMRRVIVISGEVMKRPKRVRYDSATAYWDPDIQGFVESIMKGAIYIDFDARTKTGTEAIRNHGTKFRVHIEGLEALYDAHQIILP